MDQIPQIIAKIWIVFHFCKQVFYQISLHILILIIELKSLESLMYKFIYDIMR